MRARIKACRGHFVRECRGRPGRGRSLANPGAPGSTRAGGTPVTQPIPVPIRVLRAASVLLACVSFVIPCAWADLPDRTADLNGPYVEWTIAVGQFE